MMRLTAVGASTRGFVVASLVSGLLAATPAAGESAGVRGASGCPDVIDANSFASEQQLRDLNATIAGFGLRSTASLAEKRTIDWLEQGLREIDGVTTRRSESWELRRWQPVPEAESGPGRSLARAGRLTVSEPSGGEWPMPVAGAVPYALPTGSRGTAAPLVYLPPGEVISAENARGKVVVRDVPKRPLPWALFAAVSYFFTPDLLPELTSGGDYERPGLATDGPLAAELIAAGRAGAAGMIHVFDVPRGQVSGYFDPHGGTHFRVPAVYVGVDEGERLKRLAADGGAARVAVLAETDRARTSNLIATLPGRSPERIVLHTTTDGNTWVIQNGGVGVLALARYLAALPLECRPRTFEFAFTSGHLHRSRDGVWPYAQGLDEDYDAGTVAFAFALGLMGTREILPVPRESAPGRRLEFTGKGEPFGWVTGESPPLFTAAVEATQRRKLDRTLVLRGIDPPGARVPPHCAFGGLGTHFHEHLIPTMQMISGPWSVWAPSFGERAVDFERMRRQLLAAGDTVLALDDLPRQTIAGPYLAYRAARTAGAPTCGGEPPPEQAPGPGD